MKAAASALFGIVTSIGACLAAASVASVVMANSEQGKAPAAGVTDLWTAVPIRVDKARQNYIRLPPQYSSYVNDAPPRAVATLIPDAGPSRPSPVTTPPASLIAVEHVSWCTQHYKSYDPSSDSYTSFSGEIRTCGSPTNEIANGDAVAVRGSRTDVDAVAASWCAARYQSYRAKDNSYQPYNGPRRQCLSPHTDDMASADY